MKLKLKNITKILNSTMLAPILFAIYPILALWAVNFDRMEPIEVVFPLILSILGCLFLFLIFRLSLRNLLKASLLTSLIVLLFFTYGHVFGLIKGIPTIGPMIAHQRNLILLYLLILMVGGYLIIRFGKKATGLLLFLNRTALILLAFVLVQILYEQYFQTNVQINHDLSGLENKTAFDPARIVNKNNLPDIYLIVLDSYSRDDVLLRAFNYDNKPFLQKLTNLGFVVPNCTMANYAYTALAMSSELNMNYIDAFYPDVDPKATSINYTIFTDYIRHSLVRKNLTDLGYKTISFESDAHWVELPDADVFYTSTAPGRIFYKFLDSTEYDQILSDSTVFSIFHDAEGAVPGFAKVESDVEDFIAGINKGMKNAVLDPNREKYNMVMDNLNDMETISSIPGPKFVYLHLPAPHPPQVLGPNGEFQPALRVPGYYNAITYLNGRVLEIIGKIIDNAKVPPVIILQGDHGFFEDASTRMYNLNAYYMPGAGKKLVYPTITPVNTFRIIFNAYFQGKYPMLKDVSNYYNDPYFFDFQHAPTICTP